MVQVIQIKRRIGGASGAPATLQAGELGYNSADAALFIGADAGGTVQPLVHVQRQLELHAASPAQTVLGGPKTFGLANIKIPGGNPGEALTISAVDGTLVYAPVVSAAQQFVGSLDATAGTVTLTAAVGGGAALPPAAAANNGWYVITDTEGSTPPANAPAGTYQIGDWVISNGTAWNHLEFGGIDSVTAADVGVVAPVTGGTNVQEVLESMQTAEALHVSGPATSTAGFIATYADATGKLIATGIDPATLSTVAYVDSENAAQDLIITANAAFVAAQPGIDSAQDALIAAAGDVFGTAPSVTDHVATYSDITGKLIKDGGVAIGDLALKTDLTGLGDVVGPAAAVNANIAVFSTTTGKLIADGGQTIAQIQAAAGDVYSTAPSVVNNLAMFSTTGAKMIVDSGYSVQAFKTYVDDAINNIPGATPPEVFEPDLTGDGTAATPITWTGVKFAVNDPASFTGLGTTASPLSLVLVDGGTF